MQNQPVKSVNQYVKRSSRRRVWKNFVRIMAYVVVFCTTYALILPAITMEFRNTCGLEEHTHSDACYSRTMRTALICTLQEMEAHTHTDGCYTDAVHTHTDGCYSESKPVCGQQEAGHAHTDECYSEPELICGSSAERTLICDIAEVAAEDAHRHTDACMSTSIEEKLVCTLEEHTHTLSCHSDPEADLETAEDWEKTVDDVELTGVWSDDLIAIAKSQIGYTESKKNYLTEDEETKQGYTRYGAWYGVPYGGWDAMFVSFCLNYAGIPVEAVPHASSAEKWAQELDKLKLLEQAADRTPQPGDLIFFADETGKITGVEIITEIEADSSGAVSAIKTIGGDRDDEVGKGKYDASDASIAAYCGMDKALKRFVELYPEEAEALGLLHDGSQVELVTQTAETKNYLVTVTYSADLVMPEKAELKVKEYDKDSEIFRQRCEEAGYELEWLLNIGFFVGKEELDLDGAFDVVVTSKKGDTLGSDITHFTDEGAELIAGEETEVEAEEGQTAVSFSSSGFSDFGGGISRAACSHTYTYEVSTAKAVGTCSKCGNTMTIDATNSIRAVNSYAEQLRSSNIKNDYSAGQFTWDTENKTWGWTYYNGVMLDAFMMMDTTAMRNYVIDFYDDVLQSNGTPKR